MQKKDSHSEIGPFIPLMTSSAGRSLTTANWQEAGISMVCADLSNLLVKPGYDLLSQLPDLGAYLGWTGKIIINASLIPPNKNGIYCLRSPYDGSIVRHTLEEIFLLLHSLNPPFVILPNGIKNHPSISWQSLPEAMFPFFPVTDLPHREGDGSYGVYFYYDNQASWPSLMKQLDEYAHLPRYVAGDLSLPLIKELCDKRVSFIESDRPAADACIGMVYRKSELLNLMDQTCSTQFEVIDAACDCPTCEQGFTQAYLHHLLNQTPLLCQRLLIQHNLYNQNN